VNEHCRVACAALALAALVGPAPVRAGAMQVPGARGPNAPLEEPAADDVWGVGGHPIVGYGPETSLVLGLGAAFYYDSRPEDPDQRPDEYGVCLTYSWKEQGSLSLDARKYLGGNENFLDGSLELTRAPQSFYGVGPDTPDAAEENFEQRGVAWTLAFQRAVRPNLYVGPEYDLFHSDLTRAEGPLLSGEDIAGSETSLESGLGILFTWDTTNAKLYKLNGTRAELRGTMYGAGLGSTHRFGKGELDVRRYFELGPRWVLAFEGAARTTWGDVPFFYLSRVGGNRLLRGYSSERYLAKHFVGGQAELRYPLVWRFAGATFVGAGEVENEWKDFGRTVRIAGGTGVRFALNRRQTIHLRFDFTLNADGEVEKYIRLREAF
jgi:hypothetical protein